MLPDAATARPSEASGSPQRRSPVTADAGRDKTVRYGFHRLNSSELETTQTLENAIAAPARVGLR